MGVGGRTTPLRPGMMTFRSRPAMNKSSNRRRRNPDRCSGCGKLRDRPDRKSCSACLERARQRRLVRIAADICPHCGLPRASQRGRTGQPCDDCRTQLTAWICAREARRRAHGLCIICGVGAVTAQHCRKHAEIFNAREYRYRHARFAKGLCVECDRPRLEDGWQCAQHLARRNANQRRRYHAGKNLDSGNGE